MRMTGNEAAQAAKRALSTIAVCLSVAAFAAAVPVAPADAKKSRKNAETEAAVPDPNDGQPMTLVVSLGSQKVYIYRGTTLVTSSRVSSGMRGYATKAGVFSILEKKRRHFSNLYAGAPMPWMQRLTWSGTALHAGVVPGYPASHGCVRLPYSFAPKLFEMTNVGEHVVVARGNAAPKLIEHAALFQPLPPPAPPVLVDQHELHLKRQSSNQTAPAFGSGLPVVLAKAEAGPASTDTPTAIEAPASSPEAHGLAASSTAHAAVEVPAPVQLSASAAMGEDTRTHAIDPSAGPFVGSGAHAIAVKPVSGAAQDHAAVGTSDDFVKHQDRLAAPAETPEPQSGPIFSVSAAALALPAAPAPASAVVALAAPATAETAESNDGPVVSVQASAMAQPVAAPVAGLLEMTVVAEEAHPPIPPEKPSIMAAKLVAGTAAAGVEAAEPHSTAPLRILVTRRTQRDRMIDVQYMLASMGYLDEQNFDGTFGRLTAYAIKAFQKASGLPETGAFTDDVVKKIYEVAGKDEPPTGHLFVRQEFASVFDTAVNFRSPDEPLGTHVFTVMKFEPGDTKAQWMAISLQDDDDPMTVLDRLVIPDDVRQNISERLTPGSSLIIADTAINSATLPKGADFLVWDSSKAKVHQASISDEAAKPRPRKKRRATTARRTTTTYTRPYQRYLGWPF
jgi:peptidoglycan hydrolase-like protein with peptidoglycan-binding domain